MKIFRVLLSETAASQLRALDEKIRDKLKSRLRELQNDPYSQRSGADIKKLRGSRDPELYRMRAGDYRVVYAIIEKDVKITEIIHMSRGYKWLE